MNYVIRDRIDTFVMAIVVVLYFVGLVVSVAACIDEPTFGTAVLAVSAVVFPPAAIVFGAVYVLLVLWFVLLVIFA